MSTRLLEPCLILPTWVYYKAIEAAVLTEINGQTLWNGFRVIESNFLERDQRCVTLKEMPCASTLH